MRDDRDDAYGSFEQDHRTFGAEKGRFSPSLRIKALFVAVAVAAFFWSGVFYLVFAAVSGDPNIEYLAFAAP